MAGLDPGAALDLQRDLRLSCQWQLARLQAVRDGAALAAETVQDVRLRVLEQGPVTEVGPVLMAAIVTFALESPIAGAVAQALSQRVVQPLLRTAIKAGGQVKTEAQLLDMIMPSAGASFASRMAATQRLPSARSTWLRYEAYVNWLDSPAGETTYVALAKGAYAGAQASGAAPDALAASPGVELLSQVQSWCTRHALAVQRRHTVLERWALSPDTPSEALRDLQQRLDRGGLEGLEDMRHRWRLLCEACIWAQLYAEPLAAVGRAPRFDPMGGLRSLGQLPSMLQRGLLTAAPPPDGIEERLVDYWTRQFGEFVREEVAATSQVTMSPDQDMRLAVLLYLSRVQEALARERQSAQSALAASTPETPAPCSIATTPSP